MYSNIHQVFIAFSGGVTASLQLGFLVPKYLCRTLCFQVVTSKVVQFSLLELQPHEPLAARLKRSSWVTLGKLMSTVVLRHNIYICVYVLDEGSSVIVSINWGRKKKSVFRSQKYFVVIRHLSDFCALWPYIFNPLQTFFICQFDMNYTMVICWKI